MKKHQSRFSLLCAFTVFLFALGCDKEMPVTPPDTPEPVAEATTTDVPDFTKIFAAIEQSGGVIERDANGNVNGVNLAAERTSVTDDVLKQALLVPDLKSLRVAGSNLSAEAFADLAKQSKLETLFLQGVPLADEELEHVVSAVPSLRRLTLRRLNGVSDAGIIAVLQHSQLRSLALIEMNLTRAALEKIAESPDLAALDLRHCSRLTPEDYELLASMKRLSDLKIGGFAVNDAVLKTLPSLPQLRGLAIEESAMTAEGFTELASHENWASKLELLVLSRNTALWDATLNSLRTFQGLKRLTVRDMMVSGEFLKALVETESIRTKLEQLALPKTYLNDENAGELKKCSQLKRLDLSYNMVTEEILKTVAEVKTLENLDLTGCQLDDATLEQAKKMRCQVNLPH